MSGRQRWTAIARASLVAVLVSAAAGCAQAAPTDQAASSPATGVSASSGTPAASGSPATATDSGSSASGSAAPTATGSGGSASGSTTPSGTAASASIAPGVKNLALTPELTRELLIAAATFNKLPVTAYEGLAPHSTYVGRDASGTVWAATALQPSPSSVPAQVSVQDDGSYLLLRRNPSGDWTVWSVGLASAADCARFGLPAALRTLWDWPSTGCHPHL